mgnify:FL=1
MATQRQPLETIEGKVTATYDPSPGGANQYISFYVQPDGEDSGVGIKAWSNEDVVYAVAKVIEAGEYITVKVQRRPNRDPDGPDYLNAKEIIRSGRDISAIEADDDTLVDEPVTAVRKNYMPSARDEWTADGMKQGNSKTNATALVVAHLTAYQTLPSEEWLSEAADLVNFGARAIRCNAEPVEPDVEDSEEGGA